ADRFRAALAAGRTPARINIERSLNQVEGYLDPPIERDPFVNLAGAEGWDGLDAWRDELATAVREHVRPAFARYRDVLRDELLPRARPDDRPGLLHLDDGEELYRGLIELHTGLPLTPDELHRIWLEGEDTELSYRDGDEILLRGRACRDAATAAVPDWFGSLPQAPCEVAPAPDYLAAHSAAAYCTPPAPDGSRPGEYHVNLHDPP